MRLFFVKSVKNELMIGGSYTAVAATVTAGVPTWALGKVLGGYFAPAHLHSLYKERAFRRGVVRSRRMGGILGGIFFLKCAAFR